VQTAATSTGNLIKKIVGLADSSSGDFSMNFNLAVNGIVGDFTGVCDDIKKVANTINANLAAKIQNAINMVVNEIKSIYSRTSKVGQETVRALKSTLSSATSDIRSAKQSISSQIPRINVNKDFGDVRGQIVSVGKVIDDVLPSPALIKLLLPLATLILVIGALYVFYKIYDILFKPMIYDKMHRRIK